MNIKKTNILIIVEKLFVKVVFKKELQKRSFLASKCYEKNIFNKIKTLFFFIFYMSVVTRRS